MRKKYLIIFSHVFCYLCIENYILTKKNCNQEESKEFYVKNYFKLFFLDIQLNVCDKTL